MDRRDFLKVGTAAIAGLGVAEAGCATTSAAKAAPPPVLDAEQVERTLERIDRRMAAMAEEKPDLPGFREGHTPEERALIAARTRLYRQAARTFYLGGAFLELSETDRCHPGVQERLRRMQPEMDAAVRGVSELLSTLTPEELKAIQQQLREEPDVGQRVSELVSEAAKEDGFSFQRRLDLRLAFDDLSRRLRAQNPSLVIDPVLRKVKKLELEVQDPAYADRQAKARLGEEAFWEMRRRTEAATRAWASIYDERPRADLARLERTYPLTGSGGDPMFGDPPDDAVESARRVLKIGAWTFGIGAGLELLGGFFALANLDTPAIVLGVTVGPVLMGLGLLILLVGGIYYFAVTP